MTREGLELVRYELRDPETVALVRRRDRARREWLMPKSLLESRLKALLRLGDPCGTTEAILAGWPDQFGGYSPYGKVLASVDGVPHEYGAAIHWCADA
jgi:hypothetical protein